MGGNDECIDKSSDMVSKFFNNTWIFRYLIPRKVVFNNGYKFKRDLTPLVKDVNMKPVLITVKNTQSNATVERVHQVIYNILVNKYLDKHS